MRGPGGRSWALVAAATLTAALLVVCRPVGGGEGVEHALPGALPFDEDLRAKLSAARESKGPDYRPRTRHLGPDGSALYTNRLLLETSPYLLQHAHNPVSWHPGATRNFEGRSILNVPRSPEAVAAELGTAVDVLTADLERAGERLLAARSRRPAPARDEKSLAAWNGLMISAFARAGFVLGEDDYTARAARAADFVLTRMRDGERLQRSYKDGRAHLRAYLEDYAFVIAGLLDLFEATGEPRWLREATVLDAVLESSFEDPDGGGYFLVGEGHEPLLAREKPAADDAEPSGNSVQALNLLRLHELTTDDDYRRRAERTLAAFAPTLAEYPSALPEMLLAVSFHHDVAKEIVIVTPSREEA